MAQKGLSNFYNNTKTFFIKSVPKLSLVTMFLNAILNASSILYLLYLLINISLETFFKLNVSMNENELDISFVRVAAPVVCNKSALGCHNYPRWVHSALHTQHVRAPVCRGVTIVF